MSVVLGYFVFVLFFFCCCSLRRSKLFVVSFDKLTNIVYFGMIERVREIEWFFFSPQNKMVISQWLKSNPNQTEKSMFVLAYFHNFYKYFILFKWSWKVKLIYDEFSINLCHLIWLWKKRCFFFAACGYWFFFSFPM